MSVQKDVLFSPIFGLLEICNNWLHISWVNFECFSVFVVSYSKGKHKVGLIDVDRMSGVESIDFFDNLQIDIVFLKQLIQFNENISEQQD